MSIRQPWLHAIINHGKTIENRSWPTKIRGRICLHASLGMKSAEFDDAMDDIFEILGKSSFEHTVSQQGMRRSAYDDYTRTKGKIIATADLVECVSRHDSPWFFGSYGFVLADVQLVEPNIPVVGKLGFFDWRARVKGGVA
ncbi:hypothetical protein ABI_15110 [Asticcacaulis biprosthecium C19]|uniref:Uncharacterized protein n=1 Tax=Asticcacaulis biprosthecium C19 TaxID=715226 RepID=F4QJ08_9CAUL|nr:hypothetical protein ABI_15110 [Asticcacaulis biprosthecium C19]